MRRRGLGDAVADAANYRAMAAQVPPGSALYNAIMACAANPTPTCATASASWFSGNNMSASESAAINQAIAAGGAIPFEPGYQGPPPGTYLPTPAPAPALTTPAPAVAPAPSPAAVVNTATPNIQPVLMVQPANAPSPTDTTAAPASPSFFSTPILGIPLWAWGIAAVGGYFLFAGGQHGRF